MTKAQSNEDDRRRFWAANRTTAWEIIDSNASSDTDRLRVSGGWIVRSWCFYEPAEDDRQFAVAMVFVPDLETARQGGDR